MIAPPRVTISTIDHSKLMPLMPMTIPPVNQGKSWTSIFSTLPIDKDEMELLNGCRFLPRDVVVNHLKSRNWTPQFGTVLLYTIVEDITKQRAKNKKMTAFMMPKDREKLYLKLADLSDTHGILSLYCGTIWLAEAKDPKNLNIDAEVMGEIGNILSDESPEMESALAMQSQLSIIRNSMYGFGGQK